MAKKEKQTINTTSEISVEPITKDVETLVEVTPVTPTKTKNKKIKSETTKKATTKATKATQEVIQETASEASKETVKEVVKEVVKIVTPEIYLQFAGLEFNSSGILNQAREAWIASGHDENAIESLKVYIKPEDAAAYYVVNETEKGKIEL